MGSRDSRLTPLEDDDGHKRICGRCVNWGHRGDTQELRRCMYPVPMWAEHDWHVALTAGAVARECRCFQWLRNVEDWAK